MTDRELLEMAAKAAGIDVRGRYEDEDTLLIRLASGRSKSRWNPLTDDGDALRLAVKLHMTVRCYMGTTVAQIGIPGLKNAYEEVTNHDDPAAATRRAIVRAAAEIGRSAS